VSVVELRDLLREIAGEPARQSRWLQVCALLDRLPEDENLEVAADLIEEHLGGWPERCRLPPDNWRDDWEQGRPQPRLRLVRGLTGWLPAQGGGSHPVQYYISGPHGARYYVRCRHGGLSIDDADDMYRVFYRYDIPEPFGADIWLPRETNVLLYEICAAILEDRPGRPRFPGTVPALRAHPKYYEGIYPVYVGDGGPHRSFCNLRSDERERIVAFDRGYRAFGAEYTSLGLEPE
jgi:hypothetical protein